MIIIYFQILDYYSPCFAGILVVIVSSAVDVVVVSLGKHAYCSIIFPPAVEVRSI